MGGKDAEACGRCAMTSVVGVTQDDQDDEERARRDPFGSSRIEVDERDLRVVSPSAWLGGVRTKLDEIATRLTYGRP